MRIQFSLFLVIAISLFVTTSCTEKKQEENGDIKNQKFEIAGVSVTAPDESGWELLNSSASAISFMKQSDTTVTVFNVTLLPSEAFKDDTEFMIFSEEFMNKRWSPLEMKSVHFNRIQFHESACLQYDGLFRDSLVAGTEKEFLTTRGLLCRHPANKLFILHVDMTHHSADKTISEKTIATYLKFIESVSFTKKDLETAQKNPH